MTAETKDKSAQVRGTMAKAHGEEPSAVLAHLVFLLHCRGGLTKRVTLLLRQRGKPWRPITLRPITTTPRWERMNPFCALPTATPSSPRRWILGAPTIPASR